MKYKTSIKTRCNKCKMLRRSGKLQVRCENKRHNQTQG